MEKNSLDFDMLTFACKDGSLIAPRCIFVRAARGGPFQGLIDCAEKGEIPCPEDQVQDWQCILDILDPGRVKPLKTLIHWDNVVPVFKLAHKYDIASVQDACHEFLTTNAKSMMATPTDGKYILKYMDLLSIPDVRCKESYQVVFRQFKVLFGSLKSGIAQLRQGITAHTVLAPIPASGPELLASQDFSMLDRTIIKDIMRWLMC